jgi:hypothetical protein
MSKKIFIFFSPLFSCCLYLCLIPFRKRRNYARSKTYSCRDNQDRKQQTPIDKKARCLLALVEGSTGTWTVSCRHQSGPDDPGRQRQEDSMNYEDYFWREFLKQLAGGIGLAILAYICICIVMGIGK